MAFFGGSMAANDPIVPCIFMAKQVFATIADLFWGYLSLKTPLFHGEVWQYSRFYVSCCGLLNIKAQTVLTPILFI